jgi:hypothetical protein
MRPIKIIRKKFPDGYIFELSDKNLESKGIVRDKDDPPASPNLHPHKFVEFKKTPSCKS